MNFARRAAIGSRSATRCTLLKFSFARWDISYSCIALYR
jgi:hypothetical protein